MTNDQSCHFFHSLVTLNRFSSRTESKAYGCMARLSLSDKLTGHVTKMDDKNKILKLKQSIIMLKVKFK